MLVEGLGTEGLERHGAVVADVALVFGEEAGNGDVGPAGVRAEGEQTEGGCSCCTRCWYGRVSAGAATTPPNVTVVRE